MPSTPRFARVTVTMFFLLATSCSGYARHGSVEPTKTILPRDYKANISLPPIARLEDFTSGRKGLLRMKLFDNYNRPVAGATIRFKGPQTGSKTTDARGVAEVLITPGRYEVDVAPCGASVITNDYQSAVASVVAGGQPSQGAFSGIRWQRRYHPVASVSYSDDPPWKVGRTVRSEIRVEDRCPDAYGAAARASLSTYRWKLSSNFQFTAAPVMRSDARGLLHIAFRCVATGNGGITIYDPSAAGDEPLNIIEAGAGPGSGHRYCER